jgi:hypothetical protein
LKEEPALKKSALLAGVASAGLGFAVPASAGNIVLTGHDNDFHESAAAHAAALGALNLVRNGSTLPVLIIDNGGEAVNLVNSVLGVGHEVTKSVGSITAADFDHSVYSAFVVASVTTCGGCDNPVGTGTTLAGFASAIAAFFNAGGGIYGLAGASDPSAYAYVPESATNAGGSPPSTGYVTTAAGTTLGVPAVNGDTTHNFFNEPGTGGLSSLYVVTERLGSATTGTPETIALVGGSIKSTGPNCVITGTHPRVPEPMSLSLLGAGLFGLAAARRRWRQ